MSGIQNGNTLTVAPRPDDDLAPLVVRDYAPTDADAALACNHAVFHAARPGQPRLSAAHWHWKFHGHSSGRHLSMVAEHPEDGLVGLYGAIPIEVTRRGVRRLAAQGVDQGVRAAWLRHGGEAGLFVRLGQAFQHRWLHGASDGIDFLYGLPVAGWRSGARRLGWQIARDWDLTYRELAPGAAPRPVPADLHVEVLPRAPADVDALFAAVEPSLPLATVRDRRYLDWRYADHPDRRHELLACRERGTGRLRGLAVTTVGDLVRPHTTFVLDWLQALDDADTMAALLGTIEARARAAQTGFVASVWNAMDPRFAAMQEHGYRVRGTAWFLAVAAEAYDPVYFRENFWFTLGDSDLL